MHAFRWQSLTLTLVYEYRIRMARRSETKKTGRDWRGWSSCVCVCMLQQNEARAIQTNKQHAHTHTLALITWRHQYMTNISVSGSPCSIRHEQYHSQCERGLLISMLRVVCSLSLCRQTNIIIPKRLSHRSLPKGKNQIGRFESEKIEKTKILSGKFWS